MQDLNKKMNSRFWKLIHKKTQTRNRSENNSNTNDEVKILNIEQYFKELKKKGKRRIHINIIDSITDTVLEILFENNKR